MAAQCKAEQNVKDALRRLKLATTRLFRTDDKTANCAEQETTRCIE